MCDIIFINGSNLVNIIVHCINVCMTCMLIMYFHTTLTRSGVARGGGRGGASAPGRRPEGGAKIMPKNFLKFIY